MSHLECSLVGGSTRFVEGYACKSNICVSTMWICRIMWNVFRRDVAVPPQERVTGDTCEAYGGKNEPQQTFNSEVGTYTAVLKKFVVTVETEIEQN
jgi:hypothetical protein